MASSTDDQQERKRPYRGLDPEARRTERRQRLLEATLELSATNGFTQTTIQDICRQAGVTARHFYEEFESRETLLETLYTDLMRDTVDVVIQTLADLPVEPELMVHEGLSAYMHAMLDDPRRAHIILFEVFALPGGVLLGELGVNAFVDLLQQFGDALDAAGKVTYAYRPATGIAISGAMKELMIHWLRSEPRPPLDELIEASEAVFRRLMLLPEHELAPGHTSS